MELLTMAELRPLVDEAVKRWETVVGDGRVGGVLEGVEFRIADLPSLVLGYTVSSTVFVDDDAAGFGWFVDATASSDEEFAKVIGPAGYEAIEGGPSEGRIDLLTVVMHEVGHLLGLEEVDAAESPSNVMAATLDAGLRRLPTDDDAARLPSTSFEQPWSPERRTVAEEEPVIAIAINEPATQATETEFVTDYSDLSDVDKVFSTSSGLEEDLLALRPSV